jgi:alcohol dehydrogenase YqhD (iron-dependent ADH family)
MDFSAKMLRDDALADKVIVVTGGGSVKRNGTFDRAVASLEQAGVTVVECPGIEPNPRITSVARGARIAREEKCDIIVALGGGSTMDAAKVIAASVLMKVIPGHDFHGQGMCIYQPGHPVVTVPTLATGPD